MATMVEFDRFSAEDGACFVFRAVGSDEELYVYNFCNGIATIYCEGEDTPSVSASTISGCFDDGSNLASELCKIFMNDDGTMQTNKLEAIHLKTHLSPITVEIKKRGA